MDSLKQYHVVKPYYGHFFFAPPQAGGWGMPFFCITLFVLTGGMRIDS